MDVSKEDRFSVVEAKASDDEHDPSDAALPWIEISSGDQTTEQVLPSSPSDSSDVSTPNADGPSDTEVPEEEPFMIITPEQSSSPVNDSPVEVATDDYELVGDVPQPGTTLEAISVDETETKMEVDDSTS
ncbi:hypothetical protein M378DRAFT_197293 [Amanita muscaria Koide BX008]|uniref:Uncharacterized protein n=1 Tax=Amanita muscaria (strain Koide BX008) TaxID=946122 RepID=A0A0C2XCN9_AMAMK|nr:hypothetical protein M378DRAFT_197293 [Amanita muscaria Koide BX008]